MRETVAFPASRAAILFLLIAVCTGFPTFDEYCKEFNKHYSKPSEYAMRAQIYNNKIKMFKQITDFTPGINKMTDWTDEEINKLRNAGTAFAMGLKSANMNIGSVLTSSAPGNVGLTIYRNLNWTANGKVTAVKNQGWCGSCWAFATIAQAESHAIIYKNFSASSVDFAEQRLVQCVSNYGCGGASNMNLVMQEIVKGVVDDKFYPYKASASYYSSAICTDPRVTKLSDAYEYYGVSSDQDLQIFLQAGPVAVIVSANNLWTYYKSGVMSCTPTDTVNHVVLLVGYTDTEWIIKNQWGTGWGEYGYMRLKKGGTNAQSCYLRTGVMRLKIYCQASCQICMTTTQCALCYDSTYNKLDANGNCNCPIGKEFSNNLKKCVDCFGGKIWINGKCACQTGFNWNGASCVSCSGGKVWSTTLLACVCPSSQTWNGVSCVAAKISSLQTSQPKCSLPEQWNGQKCTLMPSLLSVSIQVDLDFDQFGWEDVPHIREILADTLGTPYSDNPNLITITGFRKGSVIVDAEIKAENDEEAQKVKAQLIKSNFFLGAPVKSVNAEMNSEEREGQLEGSLSPGQIAGIIIGSLVTVLIIALIAVKLACFRAKKEKQTEEGETQPRLQTRTEEGTHTETCMQAVVL